MAGGFRETDVPIDPLKVGWRGPWLSPDEHGVAFFVETLKFADDDYVRIPLWEFPPSHRPAVIHERRTRWGVDDEEGVENG